MISVLFLDMAGVFDNVNHKRLIHNLRKRKFKGDIINLIESFLKNRETDLRLPDYETGMKLVDTGIL